jgi:hypothetical protein
MAWINDMISQEEINHQVKRHLSSFFEGSVTRQYQWKLGAIEKTLPDFRVLEISPDQQRAMWLYASCGAWAVDSPDGYRQEFLIASPSESPSHVETLAMLANFYADEKYSVSVGKMIDVGRPWMDGATCNCLLVSLPYPFGPKFEWLNLEIAELLIRFLWLIPITSAEKEYAELHGIEALEKKFEDAGIDYLDIHRKSVVNT